VSRPTLDEKLRGIPLWLVEDYLRAMGGRQLADGRLEGGGWTVRLSQAEDFTIGSLRVGQVRLEVWGAPEMVAPFRAALGQRLMRGGG
jgi:hypothetical protein